MTTHNKQINLIFNQIFLYMLAVFSFSFLFLPDTGRGPLQGV